MNLRQSCKFERKIGTFDGTTNEIEYLVKIWKKQLQPPQTNCVLKKIVYFGNVCYIHQHILDYI